MGEAMSAVDVVFMPSVQGILRVSKNDSAIPLDLGFQNFNDLYPNIAGWLKRMETIPGYDNAYPPHWRE